MLTIEYTNEIEEKVDSFINNNLINMLLKMK